MLRDVDEALRGLFRAGMTTLGAGTPAGVTDGQVGFGPPDTDWISDVSGLSPNRAINVYLADLRENRALRSNERLSTEDGNVRPAPVRLDCHYLVSAWSPSAERRTKTLEEHDVLSEALEVLTQARMLTVGDSDLPLTVVPAEGFGKLAEFWGTMGQKHRWKPVISLVVTVPVEQSRELTGAAVTTRFAEYRSADETWIQIGGLVQDASSLPVTRAWVQIQDAAGTPIQATRTNAAGEFTFTGLAAGTYWLLVRSASHARLPAVQITVPSPTGRYDLTVR
jgi:Pvc16 N-terminal domain/Carboxypeptidase regulatory-like domain